MEVKEVAVFIPPLDIDSVRDRQTEAIKELFEAVDNLGKEAEFDALFDKVNQRK